MDQNHQSVYYGFIPTIYTYRYIQYVYVYIYMYDICISLYHIISPLFPVKSLFRPYCSPAFCGFAAIQSWPNVAPSPLRTQRTSSCARCNCMTGPGVNGGWVMVGEWLKKVYLKEQVYIESMDWIGFPGERKTGFFVWNMLKPSNFQRRTGVSTVWPTNSVGQPSSKISRSALQGKQQHWWRVFSTPKPATVGFCRLGSPRLNTNYTSRLDEWEWPTWYPSSQHQIKATIASHRLVEPYRRRPHLEPTRQPFFSPDLEKRLLIALFFIHLING